MFALPLVHRCRTGSVLSRRLAVASLLLIAAFACPHPSQAQPQTKGRWTPPQTWSSVGVHVALLPGYGSNFHSKVMWWLGSGAHEQFDGGLWGWNAPTSTFDCTTYPASAFSAITLAPPILPGSSENAGVFCASESHMASGELLLAGGTQKGTENGMRHVYRFSPFTNSWTSEDSMAGQRWYGTSTLMDGRSMVAGGSRHNQLHIFGGRDPGTGTLALDSLHRYGIGYRGIVDPAVLPNPKPSTWPAAREGHTAVYNNGGQYGAHYFGGRLGNGLTTNNCRLMFMQETQLGSDHLYDWQDPLLKSGNSAPSARCDHAAVKIEGKEIMLVMGGIDGPAANPTAYREDLMAFMFDTTASVRRYFWQAITPSGAGPGPLFGHQMIHDYSRNRVLIFGGRHRVTGAPMDTLWAANFDANYTSASWQAFAPTGTWPTARYDHAMAYTTDWPDTAFLFGGAIAGGGKTNDLWRLNLASSPSPTWTQATTPTIQGTPPSPRSDHTLMIEGGHKRLLVFGGTTTTGSADDTVYACQAGLHAPTDALGWTPFSRYTSALTGHSAMLFGLGVHERVPEIYDPSQPSGQRWTRLTSAPRYQEWYPQNYLWKTTDGGTTKPAIFYAAPVISTGYLRDSSGTWVWSFPQSSGTLKGGASVMYAPGKIMKAGSRDTDGKGISAVGSTMIVDLNQGTSAPWSNSSNTMIGRVNHNLVVLPDGKVLVAGGIATLDNQQQNSAVKQPQIWDPAGASGAGSWSASGALESSTVPRGYHSTALLLPDGRVLCTGGSDKDEADKPDLFKADIYCPPYLFNSSGAPATRPVIDGSTDWIRYGQKFWVCLPWATNPNRLCLIRPGAVTHGFDANQRYIPLAIDNADPYETCLRIAAIPDSFAAPPGDYMLFVINDAGVPSIAKWVRLGSTWNVPDAVAPDGISDLFVEFIGPSSMGLAWSATGDDGPTGVAAKFDLRYSQSAITGTNFEIATTAPGAPPPTCPGTGNTMWVGGLASDACHWFAVKGVDESANAGPISNVVCAKTLSSTGSCPSTCGSGGGFSAQRPPDDEGSSSPAPRVLKLAPPPAAAIAGDEEVLVAEYRRSTTTQWKMKRLHRSSGLGLPAEATGIVVQSLDPDGGWRTRYVTHSSDPQLGVRSLARDGRVVFLGGFELESVQLDARGFDCISARHSVRGNLLSAAGPPAEMVGLVTGDSLELEYASSASRGEDCFFIVRAVGVTPSLAGRPLGPDDESTAHIGFKLEPAVPEGGGIRIAFNLPVAEHTRLEVFDVSGRRLATLVDESLAAGRHEARWDGALAGGERGRAGVYFYRLIAGVNHARRTVVLKP